MYHILKSLTSSVENPSGLISSQIREVVNLGVEPINIDPAILFSVSDIEDEGIFSETSLLFKRHNSSTEAAYAFIEQKKRFIEYVRKKGYFTQLGSSDLVSIEVPTTDMFFKMELYRTENLARETIKMISSNCKFAETILERLNISAARKFSDRPPKFETIMELNVPDWVDQLCKFEIPDFKSDEIFRYNNLKVHNFTVGYV